MKPGPTPRQAAGPACAPDEFGSCSICADEGRIGEVVSVEGEGLGAVGHVLVDGAEEEVALDLLDGVRPGERLVVHLGFAIARVEGS